MLALTIYLDGSDYVQVECDGKMMRIYAKAIYGPGDRPKVRLLFEDWPKRSFTLVRRSAIVRADEEGEGHRQVPANADLGVSEP